ncbi:RICIN domain-containing protein [Longispora fulva]|uniref:Ricin B lectin domain-containing protein n=1 Tax=Longispora fulva TaxID=619741 RepID=A0A8J7GNV0_9ACTN|nr:RICIN domain-containing protein [Longispora fulva]MBG6136109.1 hypothetical protein [Longispora fulva]
MARRSQPPVQHQPATVSSGAAGAGRGFWPLATRARIIGSGVAVACLAGAALTFTLVDFSPSPAARVRPENQAATRAVASSTPAHTTKPTTTRSPSPSPRPTQGVPNGALLNPGTGKCLSGSAGSDGTPLILAPCDGSPNQKRDVAADGTIRTLGLCYDAAWGATAPGTIVQLANCRGNPAQQFALRGDTIHSKQADLCVGAARDGAEIRLLPCDGAASKTFNRG